MGAKSTKEKNYCLETIVDHQNAINCFAVSEDQSLIVTASEDATAMMWSANTEDTEALGVLKGHTSYITCITIFDTYIITGSADHTIRKWDMTTCECNAVYAGHTSRISRIICSGVFIFSTSYDKTCKAWFFESDSSLTEQEAFKTFQGHTRGVYPIIFIPADDKGLNNVDRFGISPQDLIITGSADNTAKSWSLDTGGCLKTYKGHRNAVTCMGTCPQGKILYTGSLDHDVRAWNISMGTCLKVMEGHTGPVLCLSVVNRLMYTGGSDGTARCWVREFGDCTRVYKKHEESVVCIKFHNGILFTGSGDCNARAFDAKSGVLKRLFKGHENAITCLTVVDKRLYTGSSDGSFRVWDADKIGDEEEEEEQNDEEDEDEEEEGNNEYKKKHDELDNISDQLDGFLDEPDKTSK